MTEQHGRNQQKSQPVLIHPLANYVTEDVASLATGYTVKAIQKKREAGVWLEGREWIKAPDGRVLISIDGYNRWVMSGRRS